MHFQWSFSIEFMSGLFFFFRLRHYCTKAVRSKGKILPCSHFQIIWGFSAVFRCLVLPFWKPILSVDFDSLRGLVFALMKPYVLSRWPKWYQENCGLYFLLSMLCLALYNLNHSKNRIRYVYERESIIVQTLFSFLIEHIHRFGRWLVNGITCSYKLEGCVLWLVSCWFYTLTIREKCWAVLGCAGSGKQCLGDSLFKAIEQERVGNGNWGLGVGRDVCNGGDRHHFAVKSVMFLLLIDKEILWEIAFGVYCSFCRLAAFCSTS